MRLHELHETPPDYDTLYVVLEINDSGYHGVVGVYSNKNEATKMKKTSKDYYIEESYLNALE